MAGIPTKAIFSLVFSLLGFFATVTSVALYYYRRYYRRLERLDLIQRATGGRELTSLGARWVERPVIWEMWADRCLKPTSKWGDILPLNMTYDHDQLSTRWPSLHQSWVLPAPKSRGVGWRSVRGTAGVQLRPRKSSEGSQPNPITTDCSVSVFIAMPTSRQQPSIEYGDEFAIGTAEVVYHHPKHSCS